MSGPAPSATSAAAQRAGVSSPQPRRSSTSCSGWCPGTTPGRLPSPPCWPASHPRLRPPPPTASAAVGGARRNAAALAAGAVWWQTADDRELASNYRHTLTVAHGHDLSAAPLLLAGGAETGTVFAYRGSPSWMYVTFRSTPRRARYDVRLLTKDGRQLALRPFTARPGGTAWGSTIRCPSSDSENRIHQVQPPDNDCQLRLRPGSTDAVIGGSKRMKRSSDRSVTLLSRVPGTKTSEASFRPPAVNAARCRLREDTPRSGGARGSTRPPPRRYDAWCRRRCRRRRAARRGPRRR